MRPNILAEAVARIQRGEPREAMLAEFVDRFDLAPSKDDRHAAIAREPDLTGDPQRDAPVGGIAEYLARQRRLGRVPPLVGGPARRPAEPWFTTSSPSPAMREYLPFAGPGEFSSRNIFTEERPLQRPHGLSSTRTLRE
jgi:hypothetical protein